MPIGDSLRGRSKCGSGGEGGPERDRAAIAEKTWIVGVIRDIAASTRHVRCARSPPLPAIRIRTSLAPSTEIAQAPLRQSRPSAAFPCGGGSVDRGLFDQSAAGQFGIGVSPNEGQVLLRLQPGGIRRAEGRVSLMLEQTRTFISGRVPCQQSSLPRPKDDAALGRANSSAPKGDIDPGKGLGRVQSVAFSLSCPSSVNPKGPERPLEWNDRSAGSSWGNRASARPRPSGCRTDGKYLG